MFNSKRFFFFKQVIHVSLTHSVQFNQGFKIIYYRTDGKTALIVEKYSLFSVYKMWQDNELNTVFTGA